MLKKIILIVLAVLIFSGAAAGYLFSVNSYDELSSSLVVTVDEDSAVYVIRFVDPDGEPVPGVMANVCDDTSCTMLTSDEEGVAHFSDEIKDWYLQILKVPEGFAFASGEKLPLDKNGGETVITLNRK